MKREYQASAGRIEIVSGGLYVLETISQIMVKMNDVGRGFAQKCLEFFKRIRLQVFVPNVIVGLTEKQKLILPSVKPGNRSAALE